MAKRKSEYPVFEIAVVLAIVAIVAITGQVLMHFERTEGRVAASSEIVGPSGLVIADSVDVVKKEFVDISVEEIKLTTPSPLIGEPFEIRVVVANKGFDEISTPFYVAAEIVPSGKVKSTTLIFVVTQALAPGEKATALFRIATVTKEGPMKIIATADSTKKLDDDNPFNNIRSKTIIITRE